MPSAPVLRSTPAHRKGARGGAGSGYSAAACGGGGGGDPGSKTEWKFRGAAPSQPGRAPRPGSTRAASALAGLRPDLAPAARPAAAARLCSVRRRAGPLSGGEPVVVAAAAQDVPGKELGGVPAV